MKLKYLYWRDEEMWLGYLEDYPDYWTQGETEAELRENLADLYTDLSGGTIPNARRWGVTSSGTAGGTATLARKFLNPSPDTAKSRTTLPDISSACSATIMLSVEDAGVIVVPTPSDIEECEDGGDEEGGVGLRPCIASAL